MKRISVVGLVCAIAVGLLATAAPSQGHDSHWLIHSGGGQGIVRDHRYITVCDWSVDGHQVWVRWHQFFDRPGKPPYSSARAPSGGCHREGVDILANGTITSFAVCISYEGCTGWRYHASSNWRPVSGWSGW